VRETSPWPEDFFNFAFIPAVDEHLEELSQLAEVEDWTSQHTQADHPYPILLTTSATPTVGWQKRTRSRSLRMDSSPVSTPP
jgi:hypothetical protein